MFSTAQVSHLKPEPISRSSCPDCDSSCFPIIIFNSMNSPCLWQNIPHPAPSSWSSPTEMNSSVLTLPHPFALPCQKCLELFYQVLLINLVFTLNPRSFVCITCFSPCRFFTLVFPCHHEAELTFPSTIPCRNPSLPTHLCMGRCTASPETLPAATVATLGGQPRKTWV